MEISKRMSWLKWTICFLFLLSMSHSVNVCSREGSLEVQRLIEKHISPVLEYYEYSLPSSCPLRIDRSRYYLENYYKEKLENGHYRCGKCKKEFVHEYYLLLHYERKHPSFSDDSTVCLDKYKSVFDGVTTSSIDCRSQSIQRSLVQCQKTLMRCFPSDESEFDSDLYKYMYRSLCAPMLCNATPKQDQMEEYKPITMTTIVFPVVVVIVIFVTIALFMYRKFSTSQDDLRAFSKLE